MSRFLREVSRKGGKPVRVAVLVLPLLVLLGAVCLPAFAQSTYVITDGDQVTVYSTYMSDPAQVLDRAGYVLAPEDAYTTQPGDGVSEITVLRNQIVTIDNCGETMLVNTYGESLGELLHRLDIPTNGCYEVSLPLDTPTSDGMQVQVTCLVEREQVRVEDIPFQIRYCQSAALLEGEQQLVREGENGQKRVVEYVTTLNYQEQARTLVNETVLREPVDQIVIVGTAKEGKQKPEAPAIGDGVIVLSDGEILTYSRYDDKFKATAYTHTDAGCNMITATGTRVHVGTVAVDPRLIPYGTRMFIITNTGSVVYGKATAEDCGGGIKGKQVDLYFPTTRECFQFGVRACTVYFLD